jgi:hypothetical protein
MSGAGSGPAFCSLDTPDEAALRQVETRRRLY